MTLNKNLSDWLKNFNEVVLPSVVKAGFKPTPVNAREGLANLTREYVTDVPDIPQVVDDIILTDDYNVPVRIYNPAPEVKLPVAIFMHGGGHMAGSVTVYDPICRKLAVAARHIIVSIEYRRSPENPYPAGLNDAVNSVKNVWNVLNERKLNYKKELSLIGDSGGAALVASISMFFQYDSEIEIKKQVLIYPSLDYTMSFPSYEKYRDGFLIHASKIKWYFENYFQNSEDRKKASPLWNDITNAIPNTLIFTAEYDPLHDEGVEYMNALTKAGVSVKHYNMQDMIHTFLMMEDLVKEACSFVYNETGKFLNE